MITGLDHVILVTLDLVTTTREWRERGFTVQVGGVHAGGLSQNALVGFADGSYVELFAFVGDPGEHVWAPAAARGGGWADFALGSNGLAEDAAALKDLVAREPGDGGRTRPDGLRIAWRSARLAPPLPFLIEDVTARELRVPSGAAAVHANGVRGVSRIVLGARDPAALRERYERLRERGAPLVEITAADRDGLVDVTIG